VPWQPQERKYTDSLSESSEFDDTLKMLTYSKQLLGYSYLFYSN